MSFGQIALQARNSKREGKRKEVDIIEFVESKWGLGNSGMTLFPVQRIILKAHYGIPLDDNPYGVDLNEPIPRDHPEFDEIAGPPEYDEDGDKVRDENGQTVHYYNWRVKVTDWRRENLRYMTEAGYLRFLYEEGRSNIKEVIPGQERRIMNLSLGRRSGKSFMASCILSYEAYKLIQKMDPQSYYGMPAGADIQLITVATGKEQAGLLYQQVSAHFQNSVFFGPYKANNTQSYTRFQTQADIERYGPYSENDKAKASIKVTFSPAKAKALRGAANIVIVFDEFAHVGESGENSAKNMFDAAGPSRSTFSQKDENDKGRAVGDVEGRIIAISTPLGKQGHFYRMFQTGFRTQSTDYLCIQAPTWEVNPTIPAKEFETFYLEDATVFFTEYGGEFTDRTRGWIEDERDIQRCIVPGRKPISRGIPRTPYFLGFDLGLKQDGSAVAIGHIERKNAETKIVLDHLDWIKAGEGKYQDVDRLDFDEVADWVADLCKRFHIVKGIFDRSNGIVLEQALQKRGVNQIRYEHFTPILSSDIYKNFKHFIWDAKLELFNYPVNEGEEYCGYIRELLELQQTVVSKHVTKVEAPNIQDKHDDMSDAISRMVWLAASSISDGKFIAKGGSATRDLDRSQRVIGSRLSLAGGTHPDRQFIRRRSYRR